VSEDAIGIVAAILVMKVAAVPAMNGGAIWTEKNTIQQWQSLRAQLQAMAGPAAEHL
jgi:hypothetical protein